MLDKIRKAPRKGWYVFGVVAIILGAISDAIDVFGLQKSEVARIVSITSSYITDACGWLGSDHAISGWLIVLGCLGLLIAVCEAAFLVWLKWKAEPPSPKFKTYLRDHIHGVDCAWIWDFNNHPVDLKCYCECGNQLELNSALGPFGWFCSRCKRHVKTYKWHRLNHDVIKEMAQEIERVAREKHELPTHPWT